MADQEHPQTRVEVELPRTGERTSLLSLVHRGIPAGWSDKPPLGAALEHLATRLLSP